MCLLWHDHRTKTGTLGRNAIHAKFPAISYPDVVGNLRVTQI